MKKPQVRTIRNRDIVYYSLHTVQPGMIVPEGVILSVSIETSDYETITGTYIIDNPESHLITVYGKVTNRVLRELIQFLRTVNAEPDDATVTPAELTK